jgi:CrcB protein
MLFLLAEDAGSLARMQDWLAALIWVAIGSAFGGAARYFVSGLVGRAIGETFPWGTMAVNVSGAFVIGTVAAAAQGMLASDPAWQFAVVGFLGSYTTVSSFSLQTLALARDGETLRAGANVALSLLLCLSAVTLGYWAASTMAGVSF